MRSSPRRIIVNVVVVIATIAVVLVLTEIAFRLFKPQKGFAVTVNTWDRVMGTRHIPGARGFVANDAYTIDLIINSKGLRDREFSYAKPDDTRRILCLGDSFACGYGVEAEETYAKVLEQLLNSDHDEGVGWEVLNGGVGSTGTAHQLAFFETEGHKYNADYVLLCFCQQNDYWENITSGLYTLEDGRLAKHDAPLTRARRIQRYVSWIPWYNSFSERSHLLNFVKRRVARFHYRDLAERITVSKGKALSEDAEEDLALALVLALCAACKQHECRLVMTAIPLHGSWEWCDEMAELLAEIEAEGIPFIDLASAFRREADRGVPTNFGIDRHWNTNGHRLAAQGLYGFFAGVESTPVESGPQ